MYHRQIINAAIYDSAETCNHVRQYQEVVDMEARTKVRVISEGRSSAPRVRYFGGVADGETQSLVEINDHNSLVLGDYSTMASHKGLRTHCSRRVSEFAYHNPLHQLTPFSFKMSLLVNGQFPPINPITSSDVTADERSSAIDFVNRLNHLFEEFNHDKMLQGFLPDATVYHFHGEKKGHVEHRRFFETQYGYLIPGISRHATSHVVDRDGEGVTVRYHQQHIRFAWPADAEKVKGGATWRMNDGLPAMHLHCTLIDRLRKMDEGWKLFERYVSPGIFNEKLDPPK